MSTPLLVKVPARWDTLPREAQEVVLRVAGRFCSLIVQAMASEVPSSPGQLLDEESLLHRRVAQECVDPVTAARIQAAHEDPTVLEKAELLARTTGAKPQKSTETVRITMLGGSTVSVRTPYFLRRTQKKKGRKRKSRGKSGNGVYPILATLGIHFRVTPALASEVARLVAQGTIDEARENLAVRGVRVGVKRIRGLSQKLAARGLSYRQWCIARARKGQRGSGESLRGKRLGIAVDGGRLRTRVPKKCGRRRKSGRRGFEGAWREPKVLVVYELDAKGRKRPRGLVRYDATMQDTKGLMEILQSLLCEIGAQEAAEWILLGDGAEWIWKGVPELATTMGFDRAKVIEVVDFYHATERLHKVASAVKGWSEADREAWVKRMKRHLRRGELDRVLAERSSLCRGRNAPTIRTLLDYFETHRERMRYDHFKKCGVPLSSGVVESAVRRIVNLRLKGNGIFWLIENAEGVLHLRSQLLSGRWSEFVRRVLQPECVWEAQMPAKSARKRAA